MTKAGIWVCLATYCFSILNFSVRVCCSPHGTKDSVIEDSWSWPELVFASDLSLAFKHPPKAKTSCCHALYKANFEWPLLLGILSKCRRE